MATVHRVLQTSYINGEICGPGRLVVLPEGVEAGANLEATGEAPGSPGVLHPRAGVHVAAAIFNPPDYGKPAEPARNPALDLLDGTVADIRAKFGELSTDDLTALKAAEEAGKTRKGLIEALTAEIAARTTPPEADQPTQEGEF